MKIRKKARLAIVRIIAIVSLAIVVAFKKVTKKTFGPHLNLLHYLIGSGKDRVLTGSSFKGAESAIKMAIDVYHRRYGRNGKPSIAGRYFVSSSTYYDGAGFSNRPEVFYILGCFSFTVSGSRNKWHLQGADQYDWHPADNEGHFFGSPLGDKKAFICSLGRRFLGEEYFPEKSWPTGAANSISNKLWLDMELVGAKSFFTVFSFDVEDEGVNNMLNAQNEYKREIYAEKFLGDNFNWGLYHKLLSLHDWSKATSKETKILHNLLKRRKALEEAYGENDEQRLVELVARCK